MQKRNAIPREAKILFFAEKSAFDACLNKAEEFHKNFDSDIDASGLNIEVNEHPSQNMAGLSPEVSRHVIDLLHELPHGVIGMHPDVPELVEVSNNVGTLSTDVNGQNMKLTAVTLSRSSDDGKLATVLADIRNKAESHNMSVDTGNEYPGWSPNINSPVLETAKSVYQKEFNKDPEVVSIHAGLECGIIGKRVGNMDMISIGPRIEGAHTPEERCYPDSVEHFWKYFKALLAELAG